MAIRALTNDDWGFTSNCFVCEARNDAGLRIPFFHDTESDVVFAEFELDQRFSGAPTWAHGGVSFAICDEAMAWAAIAIHGKWAVTRTSSASFERPIVIGERYRCEARVGDHDDERVATSATIRSARSGRACVTTTAEMSIVTTVQAPQLGIALSGGNERYLREPRR